METSSPRSTAFPIVNWPRSSWMLPPILKSEITSPPPWRPPRYAARSVYQLEQSSHTDEAQPQVVQQRGRSDSDSAAGTAPPPYSATMPPYASSTMSLPSRHVHYSLTYLSNCDLSARNTPPVESNRPCICKNCKRMFWSHEGSVRVADCVGHPGMCIFPTSSILHGDA